MTRLSPFVGIDVAKAKLAYLRWGRDTLGWAMYVFRHQPSQSTTAAA